MNGEVEDYTNPFLCMVWVLLMMGLIAAWAAYGYVQTLCICLFLKWGLDRWEDRILRDRDDPS